MMYQLWFFLDLLGHMIDTRFTQQPFEGSWTIWGWKQPRHGYFIKILGQPTGSDEVTTILKWWSPGFHSGIDEDSLR